MARRTTLKTNCFGLPYMGSKNSIARKIVSLLPRATHFYDLFCGGCSITHVAMLSEKWQQYHINDLSMMPQLFVDAVNGKYANERRWISREDFFRLKDTDPYVACVWSFGNDCQTYMYGKDVEPFKKALHEVHFAETWIGNWPKTKRHGARNCRVCRVCRGCRVCSLIIVRYLLRMMQSYIATHLMQILTNTRQMVLTTMHFIRGAWGRHNPCLYRNMICRRATLCVWRNGAKPRCETTRLTRQKRLK